MARVSYATQQAKIEKEISKLQKQAVTLQNKRRQPVIASIVKSMREYDITAPWPPNPATLKPARPGAAGASLRAGWRRRKPPARNARAF